MVKTFSQIMLIINKLNKGQQVLQIKEIIEQKENIIDFANEKSSLLSYMVKLEGIRKNSIQSITSMVTNDIGPMSIMFADIYGEVGNYLWQFDAMKYFIKPLVNVYRQKARRIHCVKERYKNNPILHHVTNIKYVSTIPELEQLISLLALHNSYLEEKAILTPQEINTGIDIAKELSAMSIDIQEILYNLEQMDPNDICGINPLLSILYGKIAICCEYIHTLNWDIIRKMANYPDWNHVAD